MSRSIIALAAVAVLSLGVVACTPAEQAETKSDASAAADTAADTAGNVAAQAGEVIESGAMRAAQATEEVAGKAADKLEANQAEAAAEGRPGAVNPATDERVPAPAH